MYTWQNNIQFTFMIRTGVVRLLYIPMSMWSIWIKHDLRGVLSWSYYGRHECLILTTCLQVSFYCYRWNTGDCRYAQVHKVKLTKFISELHDVYQTCCFNWYNWIHRSVKSGNCLPSQVNYRCLQVTGRQSHSNVHLHVHVSLSKYRCHKVTIWL